MTDIGNVVEATLRKNGTKILNDRNGFLTCIQDCLGPETRETKLLGVGCDDAFLGFFSTAMESATKESLMRASQEGADYLADTYVLDPEVSKEVATGIATGCGTFLGINMSAEKSLSKGRGVRRAEKNSKRSIGTTIITSVAVFALMSALSAAILSHYFPYLGCTVLPRKATVQGVECSWYTIKDISGKPTQVMFLHNTQDQPLAVTAKPGYGDLQPRALIRANGDGLLILEGDNGTENIRVVNIQSEGSRLQFKLTWSYKQADNGDILIEINNDGDRELYRSDVVLAQHGAFVNLRLLRSKKTLDQGTTEYRLASTYQFSHFGDPLVIDEETELYVDGTKVPRV